MIIREMTQDMDNKIMTRNIGNLTWGLSPCEIDELTARRQRAYGSLATSLRLVLTLLLMMVVGVNTAWGQTYYVFKYDGHYVAHNGYTTDGSEICVEDEFSITKCLWEYTAGTGHENQKYLRTYAADYWLFYLSDTSDPNNYIHTLALKSTAPQGGTTQDGWNRANSTDGIRRYLRITSENNYPAHFVCYNDDETPCWELVTTAVNNKRALGTELTKMETAYKNVSSSISGGSNVISAFGEYNYSLGDITVNDLSYVSFTDGETTRYWYNDSEHNSAPDDWGDVEVSSLTKTWSLADGDDAYATVNAETGEVTVSHLPHNGSKTITLTCTISKDTHSYTVSKTITLKPRTLQVPTISMEGSTVTITSSDSDVDYYYTTSIYGEPYTDTPTTESTKYEEPFTLESNVLCIKAIAVEEGGPVSEVATFNILRFTNNTIAVVGSEKNVTVAPFVSTVDYAKPSGMTPYIVCRVTSLDHNAVLRELEYIPGGVPVLLLSTNTGSTGQTLSPIDLETLDVNTDEDPDNDIKPISDSNKAANQLRVSDGKLKVEDAQVYMYYNGEFVLTFAGTLKKGRFYIYNPNYTPSSTPTTNAPSLQLVIEGTTGIDEVRGKIEDVRGNVWYTLDGRRFIGQPTAKGIYINKGQKIVIK